MSNIGLELALTNAGISLVRTDVGDKYVLEELLRSGASLGGEQSGHIIMPDLSLAGDGMITAISLSRAIKETGKSLSELTAGFRQYPQVLVNVRVRQKTKFVELTEVQKVVDEVERRLAGKGRLLLRYSGTEPLARVMIEGEKQEEINDYANQIANAIVQEIGV
jgi:phosphoglucosamine mutase